MFWLLIDYYFKYTYRRTPNSQVTAFGLVTKLKSSARGGRGLCFALCFQPGEPVPSMERSHKHGAELSSRQVWTQQHLKEPGWGQPPEAKLVAISDRQTQGWCHWTVWVYCGAGCSKRGLVDLSGSAEGCATSMVPFLPRRQKCAFSEVVDECCGGIKQSGPQKGGRKIPAAWGWTNPMCNALKHSFSQMRARSMENYPVFFVSIFISLQ